MNLRDTLMDYELEATQGDSKLQQNQDIAPMLSGNSEGIS